MKYDILEDMELIIIKRIKKHLYKPQPLNYNRVKGYERDLYEWILNSETKITTRVYYNKDSAEYYIKYILW